MTLDQAQKLVSQLGTQLGGDSSTYSMDEQGESNLVFEGNTGVLIKYFGEVLIVAVSLANDINLDDPGLFPTLMDYQYLGIRTYGCVLSWNSDADTLVLSRQLEGNPTVKELDHHLEILLKSRASILEDLESLLDGTWKETGEDNASDDSEPQTGVGSDFQIRA